MNDAPWTPRKVVIVGAGAVGSTFAYALAQSGLADEIALRDANHEVAVGQVLDLAHGQAFFPPVQIREGQAADYADARMIVITAGAKQRPGESRLDLLQRNVKIIHDIIDEIVLQHSPAVVLVVSNPVDILTYFAHKRSGWSRGRIIGSGTVLDSARFRHLLSQHYNPQFNKDSLPSSLGKAGLCYRHLPGLGGLRHAERDSLNVGWRNASFRGYADYMQTPQFEQSLEELIRLAKRDRIVLMCAEAVPWRCHRSLIADALLVRGIQVEDIMSPTHRQVHVLTPFAKVRGTTITYPAEVLPSTPKKPSAKRSRPRPIKTA